jgi:hypothetical protein
MLLGTERETSFRFLIYFLKRGCVGFSGQASHFRYITFVVCIFVFIPYLSFQCNYPFSLEAVKQAIHQACIRNVC